MKLNRILILLVFCLSQYEVKCQWQIVYQDNNLYNMGVQFLNKDTGFVVGITWSPGLPTGIILRTLDGGLTWDSTYTGFGNFMIEFPSTSIGYAGGHDGSVMKTIDMGDTWFMAQSFCCNDYSNGYFFNNDSGFVIKWGGDILRTIDGANSWQPGPSIGGQSSWPGLGSIQFINASNGIAAAGFYGIYAKSSDGGNTWQSSYIDSSMVLTTIYMRDINKGYAVGYNGKYSRTFDSGNTWTVPVSLCPYNLHDIAFFNDSVGYAIGGRNDWLNNPNISNGVILKTIDAGNNWVVIDSTFKGYLTSIDIVNDSIGYIAGGCGLVLKIINGNSITSIQSLFQTQSFNIFPNPATESLSIIPTPKSGDYQVIINNILGEVVFRNEHITSFDINVSYLQNGIYVLRLISEAGVIYSKSFVKQ